MVHLDEVLERQEFSEGWTVVERRYDHSKKMVGRMLVTMLVTAVILGFLNSGSLLRWMRDLPANEASASLYAMAATWDERMHVHGFDRPHAAIHGQLETFRAMRWQDVNGRLYRLRMRLSAAQEDASAFAAAPLAQEQPPVLRGSI